MTLKAICILKSHSFSSNLSEIHVCSNQNVALSNLEEVLMITCITILVYERFSNHLILLPGESLANGANDFFLR